MSSRSNTGKTRSLFPSRLSRTTFEGRENTALRYDSSGHSTTDIMSTLRSSAPGPREEHGKVENLQPRMLVDGPLTGSVMQADAETVITKIRATDVALGLRRLPAGFYAAVLHGGLEWRTELRPSLVDHDVVEWSTPIPIPLVSSDTVCLEVYASFEFQPMLGTGEQLRRLTVTVEQLLDCSPNEMLFTFIPKDGDIVSPCSSISITIARLGSSHSGSSSSRISDPNCEIMGAFEDATNIGHASLSLYRKYGQKQDLERSVEQFEQVLNACPPDHPCRAAAQSNLATAKLVLCQVDDRETSFEDSIWLYRSALEARPIGHIDRPSTLIQLAMVYLAQSKRHRDEVGGVLARSLLQEAMMLSTTEGHENQVTTFMLQLHTTGYKILEWWNDEPLLERGPTSNLTDEDLWSRSLWLLQSFERFGRPADLEQAIAILKGLARFTSVLDNRYCGILCNLGAALLHRFKRLGQLSDVERAISMQREAVNLTPADHPDKPAYLNILGFSYITHYKRFGELSNLENAILRYKQAVDLTPPAHPDRPDRLNNLALSLRTRFERLGELGDLENAIVMHREATDLTPLHHPDKPRYLSNLGNDFVSRFEHLGELGNLETAISMHRESVDLTPPAHPDKPGRLNNFGVSFRTRFEHRGELSDLENAISIHREAVRLTPPSHHDKLTHLNNVGISFRTRFEHLGELSDLEDAISAHKTATDLVPPGHPDMPRHLSNLGTSFRLRFEHLGELNDLQSAISRHRKAADLTPPGHPRKPRYLSNLGNSLITRFKHLGELSDLEHAISSHKEATILTPPGHPHKPNRLNNLSVSFVTRFEYLGELNDLENSISIHREVVDLIPPGHPQKPSYLLNLGFSFTTRFEHLGELSDLENAISLFSHAASTPFGPIRIRFQASRQWISCAHRIRHPSLLRAYSTAVNLLPRLAWIGLSLSHRYLELMQGAGVVREAAAAALDADLPQLAVEWLERGRSIVWGELFQLRGSFEDLYAAHPDHALKLRELSAALDQASSAREKSLSVVSEWSTSLSTPKSMQHEADNHRAIAIQRDRLLEEIRKLPGFERFLRHKPFSQIYASAHTGPVVILNAAQHHCDALALLPNVGYVIHIPLPNFTLERSARLRNMMKGLARHEREGEPVMSEGPTWETLLPPLWRCVVKPVLDALAFSMTPGDLPRIFWCPTGPFAFLPIHAAGLYDDQYMQPEHKVFDFVVSSYLPSLTTLAPAPDSTAVYPGDIRLLVVSQPPSDGQSYLPGVIAELRDIETAVQRSPTNSITLAKSSLGTVEEVLGLMKDCDWVHFACHGIQDGVDSGLCLAGRRRLRVRDLAALSRPRGGLAFLSACQTAKGEEALSDEAIHIAAGMLSAGYGGVIGSMWSISDRLAPVVARYVYDYLFRNDGRPDYREGARALHEAIAHVRDSVGVPPSEWVPFIHVGL